MHPRPDGHPRARAPIRRPGRWCQPVMRRNLFVEENPGLVSSPGRRSNRLQHPMSDVCSSVLVFSAPGTLTIPC